MTRNTLPWQSKLVLLLVLPAAVASTILLGHWWAVVWPPIVLWAVGLSLLLGLGAWQTRAATRGGAFAGALITACLVLESAQINLQPWHTALTPLLAVLLLTGMATRLGHSRKQALSLAESSQGRNAAQVVANTGMATWFAQPLVQLSLIDSGLFFSYGMNAVPVLAPMLAVLAEAAADTVSSEIGQAFGGRPRLITTLRPVEPGTDGGLTLIGTTAGILAAALVTSVGALTLLGGGWPLFWPAFAGGLFGLLFDSLLGATAERRGWLNNDLVNFFSTSIAALFSLLLLALLPH